MPGRNREKDIGRRKVIAALLLGRECSAGFPGKNIYPVLGRAMMEYPLLAALNSKSVDKVYVSTDSKRIKEIGIKHKCTYFFLEPIS